MKSIKKRFSNSKRGQAVVELAITLPILLLVLCAIIDFGWLFTNKLFITYSCREGARYGAVIASETNSATLIINKVEAITPSYLQDQVNVDVTFTDIYDIRAGDVEVEVSCVVKALTPLLGIFVTDQSVPLTSICVMKVE